VGALTVVLGLAIYPFFLGDYSKGILLVSVALFVSLVDNFIRPAIMQGTAHLHPFLAFIAAFGGLKVFGITGIILGPIVAGMAVVTLQLLVADID
jgi:predicted PurR-regulated permease PerM